MWPPSSGPQQIFSNIRGKALIADDIVASASVGTTPAPYAWPNVRSADTQYDPVTGVITFEEGGFFTSVASWRVVGASARQFYADAEFSTDGGSTWIRGTNSAREVIANTTSQTLPFPFSGYFAAGVKLRFVIWSSGSGVTIQTATSNGSTSPAGRLTYSHIVGVRLP